MLSSLSFWNLLGAIFVVINCFYVPFVMSFYFASKELNMTLLVNSYFAANILVNFRTAFYSKGMLVTDQKRVFISGMNFSLLVEVTAVVCGVLYLGIDNPSLKYLTFFTLTRVRHLRGFIGKIEDNSQLEKQSSGMFKLTWLILVILTLAHLSACIFNQIAINELNTNPDNWLQLFSSPNAPVLERYVTSLYWAFCTMITVGYGDIVPTTTNERIYTVIIMAVACGAFGYSISTIGSIFSEINGNRAEMR